MTSQQQRRRQPGGTPTGGRFAPEPHAEGDVVLETTDTTSDAPAVDCPVCHRTLYWCQGHAEGMTRSDYLGEFAVGDTVTMGRGIRRYTITDITHNGRLLHLLDADGHTTYTEALHGPHTIRKVAR